MHLLVAGWHFLCVCAVFSTQFGLAEHTSTPYLFLAGFTPIQTLNNGPLTSPAQGPGTVSAR